MTRTPQWIRPALSPHLRCVDSLVPLGSSQAVVRSYRPPITITCVTCKHKASLLLLLLHLLLELSRHLAAAETSRYSTHKTALDSRQTVEWRSCCACCRGDTSSLHACRRRGRQALLRTCTRSLATLSLSGGPRCRTGADRGELG